MLRRVLTRSRAGRRFSTRCPCCSGWLGYFTGADEAAVRLDAHRSTGECERWEREHRDSRDAVRRRQLARRR